MSDLNGILKGIQKKGLSQEATARIGAVMPDAPVKPVVQTKKSTLIDAQQAPAADFGFGVVSTETNAANNSGRDIREIEVHLIDENRFAPREIYTPATIERRANALRDQGQHDAIHVIPNPDAPGRYIIADGWTRVLACREHDVLQKLLAEIHHDLTVKEAAWFGYAQNEERQAHYDVDRGQFYAKMIKDGMSNAEIIKIAKITRSALTYYCAYEKLPREVMELVHAKPEKFGSTAAYYLSKLYKNQGLAKTLALAEKFSEESRSVRWLTGRVEAILSPEKRKPGGSAYDHQLSFDNGYLRAKGDEFQVSIRVAKDKKEAFERALKELIETVAVRETKTPVDDDAE